MANEQTVCRPYSAALTAAAGWSSRAAVRQARVGNGRAGKLAYWGESPAIAVFATSQNARKTIQLAPRLSLSPAKVNLGSAQPLQNASFFRANVCGEVSLASVSICMSQQRICSLRVWIAVISGRNAASSSAGTSALTRLQKPRRVAAGAPAHAAPPLRVRACQPRLRPALNPGLPRPPRPQAHRPLHPRRCRPFRGSLAERKQAWPFFASFES